jgi:DNA-binding NarL/FixJ family response regulator
VPRELRKLRPDARVVLMSGYDERLSMDGFAAPGPAGFLHKPFRLNDVAARLREALEGQ